MTHIAKINVPAIRKFIKTVPKTSEFKSASQVLGQQLTSYENYQGDPEMATALENLKPMIVSGYEKLKARTEQRNKARA
jgi:hypothetical protein